jgi:transcriptional regulator with XRE-family HTH domain
MLRNPLMEQFRAQISSEDRALMDESFALANRIFFLLKKHNLTQRQLAEKLGKRESEVSKWLSGGHNFTAQTLIKIGIAIGERIYDIPSNIETPKAEAKQVNQLFRTSFIRVLKKRNIVEHKIKYENFSSNQISELEVNSIGVLCHANRDTKENFTQAHIDPEAFRNIEKSKVS